MDIAAGMFKAKCLKLMDDVQKFHTEIVITKFGKPVAKLVPMEKAVEKPFFGYLKDSVTIHGDIIRATGEEWMADE